MRLDGGQVGAEHRLMTAVLEKPASSAVDEPLPCSVFRHNRACPNPADYWIEASCTQCGANTWSICHGCLVSAWRGLARARTLGHIWDGGRVQEILFVTPL